MNFPDEDLEDGLYGPGDVLGNNDATTINVEAMPCCHFYESVDVKVVSKTQEYYNWRSE